MSEDGRFTKKSRKRGGGERSFGKKSQKNVLQRRKNERRNRKKRPAIEGKEEQIKRVAKKLKSSVFPDNMMEFNAHRYMELQPGREYSERKTGTFVHRKRTGKGGGGQIFLDQITPLLIC